MRAYGAVGLKVQVNGRPSPTPTGTLQLNYGSYGPRNQKIGVPSGSWRTQRCLSAITPKS